ncbi:MAG: threonine--tRNA ligase [Verrucomicrobiales bacterium]
MTPLEELRHSAAHILATAVLRLFPQAKLDIGPPTSTGFYYDFDLEHRFTPEDLERLEAEMKAVVKENQKFERSEVTREAAQQFFKEKQQPYKISRLEDIPEGEPITFYANGEFTDLCAGTHVNYTSKVKAFKLLSIAGAYHRGDEKNKQLQRIYGTAFPSKPELETHLERLEDAKRRDHRKLGKELRLFHIDDSVGQGLILWTPEGSVIRHELQKFITEELSARGYGQVFTPHIGRLGLYRTSGHFPYYTESQYPPILERETMEALADEGCSCADLANRLHEGEIDGYLLKPMNCPMHIKIFDSQPRSYRDLPVRLAEFGSVYRWEQSGELNGLTRVRGFTQDDAHIFCTEDQLEAEASSCLDLVKLVFGTLGMSDYRVRVGLRDPDAKKFTGDPALWDRAESAARNAAKALGAPFTEEPGEAAFYGPKIDFVVRDVIEREWQLGTVQIDFVLPRRFELSYIGSDNKPHVPVMVHRAPFGSMERFTGVLIEHFAGRFPLWLAPEQVRVLPITDQQLSFAQEAGQILKQRGLRVTVDETSDKLGAKIRRGELEKVTYLLVIGAREAEAGQVAVRRPGSGDFGVMSVEEFAGRAVAEYQSRALSAAS